jgi:hypothetical protein
MLLLERLQYFLFAELAKDQFPRAAFYVGLKALLAHFVCAPLALHFLLRAASFVERHILLQELLPAPAAGESIVGAGAGMVLVIDQLDQSPAELILALQLSHEALLTLMQLDQSSVQTTLTVSALYLPKVA